MVITILTKKRAYVFPDIDGFQIETDGEELKMDAVSEDGKQIVRVGEWTEDV